MPVISMFYGLIVRMYFYDNQRHHEPHIHVEYAGQRAVYRIPDGELLEGEFPKNKQRLLQAWIEIHRDELLANWQLAVNGETPFRIEPLK